LAKQSDITPAVIPGFLWLDLGRRLLLRLRRIAMTWACFLKSNIRPEVRMKSIIALLLIASTSLSQEAYEIPFGAQGNTIELTVANTSPLTATHVTVETTGTPSWVKLIQKSVTIEDLKAKTEKSATFSFDIDKLAPVNKEETLTFTITSKSGETWTKEIKIKVAPPNKFELFQNYPNPFNPTTTICYQLTKDSRVTLKVYNLLGQEVATLVDEQKQAGYHQEVFDATRFASGMYIYRIVYTNESDKQASDRKTMMVVK
jgi:flagellar hook assembly protein FlgD